MEFTAALSRELLEVDGELSDRTPSEAPRGCFDEVVLEVGRHLRAHELDDARPRLLQLLRLSRNGRLEPPGHTLQSGGDLVPATLQVSQDRQRSAQLRRRFARSCVALVDQLQKRLVPRLLARLLEIPLPTLEPVPEVVDLSRRELQPIACLGPLLIEVRERRLEMPRPRPCLLDFRTERLNLPHELIQLARHRASIATSSRAQSRVAAGRAGSIPDVARARGDGWESPGTHVSCGFTASPGVRVLQRRGTSGDPLPFYPRRTIGGEGVATSAVRDEPTWLDDDAWLADEEPDGVADDTPDDDAHQRHEGERVDVGRRFGVGELALALWFFVPQLAWMMLLGYLALHVVT